MNPARQRIIMFPHFQSEEDLMDTGVRRCAFIVAMLVIATAGNTAFGQVAPPSLLSGVNPSGDTLLYEQIKGDLGSGVTISTHQGSAIAIDASPQAHASESSLGGRARGSSPLLSFDVVSVDFGTAAVGASGPLHRVMLSNDGDVEVTGLVFSTSAGFRFAEPSHREPCYGWDTLPVGYQCEVWVKFAPTMPGPAEGYFRVQADGMLPISVPSSGTASAELLYGQFHDWDVSDYQFVVMNTTFPNRPWANSELADDFVVDDPNGWILSKVGMETAYMQGNLPAPPVVHIHFRGDNEGVPGESAICSALNSDVTLWELYPNQLDESRAEFSLSSPCFLPPGHYWLQVVFETDSEVRIYSGLQQIGDSVPIHMNPPVWRYPAGEPEYPGCEDWVPLWPPVCVIEGVETTTVQGVVFWLIGQVYSDSIFVNGFESD